ncbi:helix-turn-helix protein [Gillisia sp. Hel_I_86]|uniref:helix-turn-helix domain-containing protein n=1 Tax=Gillisia sp. Hel_I_86 TaxID=1249981 RepID=UPI00119AD6BF|nr:helix-turn-helix domain-containing protein [Gillisia sp. Hel_I_86]TVZ26706.1 helix-turn-helix protein [Gillisia sp. Hel_I_86]
MSIKTFTELDLEDLKTIIKNAVASELQNFKDFKPPGAANRKENLLSRKEAKELLQASYTTLWNYSNQGFLKPKKIGGRVYYLKSEILSYLENENAQSKTWEG